MGCSLVWMSILLLCGPTPTQATYTRSGEARLAQGSASSTASEELTPRVIVERALRTSALGFHEGDARISMLLRSPDGHVRERRLHTRSLEEDGLNRALVRVDAPPEMMGQSYLFIENRDRESDIWIHLPAIQDAPRRITGSQRNQSFLGSNVTYADLEGRQFREAEYNRLPDEELAGFPVYVIDCVNASSSYEAIRFWIRQTDFVPVRVRFFGDQGQVLKTLFAEEVAQHQGRTYIRRSTVVDRDQVATVIIIDEIDFGVDVLASEFTRESLTE